MSKTEKQTRARPSDTEQAPQGITTAPLSDQQIDRISERATRFLATLSRNGRIRSILDQGGYTAAEHQEGWSLLLRLLGYTAASPQSADEVGSPAAMAINALDQWDGPSFARARAALAHKYPAQAAYVFAGLSAKSGAESVAAVRTFLDRVAALRTGSDPARKGTKAEDKAAADLLGTRRILDAKLEAHLRRLLDDAMTLAPSARVSDSAPEDREVTARRLAAWLGDWRETARVLVTRRDYQIALGLAQRRAPTAAEGPEEDAEEEVDESAAPEGPVAPADAMTA